jgi:hypothetical protein
MNSMILDQDILIKLFQQNKFLISNHARIRMFQRNISTNEIRKIIENGEIIEDYSNDKPCPAALLLGFIENESYHIVIAQCEDHARVITVYHPEKDKWIDYRIRRDNK